MSVISFLRGQLINHDTPPTPQLTRSPSRAHDAPLLRRRACARLREHRGCWPPAPSRLEEPSPRSFRPLTPHVASRAPPHRLQPLGSYSLRLPVAEHASRRLTRSARTPRCCTREGATPERPGRLPSCRDDPLLSLGTIGSAPRHRVWLRFAPRAPLRHLPTRARVSEALVSFRLARPSTTRLAACRARTTQDASDRLLLPITLSTSTRASSVSDLRAVLPDRIRREGCFTAPFARFGGPRALFRCGAFSSPRRGAWPYLWHPVAHRALTRTRRLISSAHALAPGEPRPILPPSPWRDDGALDPRCLPSTGTRALHPSAVSSPEPWLVCSPIPRLCTPRPGSRRPFARGGPRFSLSRSTKTLRSLDPVYVNWPFG